MKWKSAWDEKWHLKIELKKKWSIVVGRFYLNVESLLRVKSRQKIPVLISPQSGTGQVAKNAIKITTFIQVKTPNKTRTM